MAKAQFGNKTPKKPITWTALKQMSRMYVHVKPYRGEFLVGLLMLLLSSGSNLAFPKYLGELVDAAQTDPSAIDGIALTLILILLAQSVFSFGRIFFFERVAQRSLASLRSAMYNHLVSLPLPFFHEKRIGELTNRLQSDIGVLQETFTSTLAEFIRQIVIIVGGIALLVYQSPSLTGFMLLVLPLVVILGVAFGSRIRKYAKDVQTASAESNTIVDETLSAVATVKAYTQEGFEKNRYRTALDHVAALGIRGGIYRGAFSSFIILGLFGALVAVIWKGASLIATGEMASGQLFSFVIYSGFIGGSVGGLADVYSRLQRAMGATEAIMAMLDEQPETSNQEPATSNPAASNQQPAVTFRNVHFAYPTRPDVPVLQGLNLEIREGQQCALVGSSGAGKSTVVQLLYRFHDPQQGELLVQGRDARDWPLDELRGRMAWVPQDVVLFGRSILENIRYSRPEASDEEVRRAAEDANAWEFIERFPDGWNTQVGERGVQLSGGQRQRIAIARAMLRDPKLLVLDEATSSLDPESESLVQGALETLMRGRTSLVIAHRLSTVRHADVIAFIHEGQIAEMGSHDELMQLDGGRYRAFVQKQWNGTLTSH
ncbi:MAG: ABC transporter transmembrane domain-containing protein [Schleiferiaceae bacterium]|jgi:ABC-type multidrug transport system fused ATPase/permease subunit|nr:ABC transporter transmembrane domain-containing protein [Schleiferiaceae bacterium]MDP4833771.1 ABC transporter transmembrane domain-containing protein [Schleiferiaceae bacterium]